MTVSVKSWDDLSLADLFYAYRKVKADCFSEHSMCVAEKFVNYEKGLADKLNHLLSQLKDGKIEEILQKKLVNSKPRVVAKKLGLAPSEISIDKGSMGKRKRINIPLPDEDIKSLLGI